MGRIDLAGRVNGSRLALVAVFALTVLLQLGFHWRSTLYDTDSHLHLAVAGLYAEQGVPENLDIARFSLMNKGFGDKEWLFHAFLGVLRLPFEPLMAGRVALALLSGFIAVVLAALARTAIGRWGLLVPFVLPVLSTEFLWRSVRLRPELLALPLLLCALALLADRRPKLLALTMALLTASYTAFHAFLGVVLLAWLVTEVAERKRDARGEQGGSEAGPSWALAVAPVVGCAAGLVLHPHFPHNLRIWLVQNVQFFLAKSELDAGSEILPNSTDVTLLANIGLWSLLAYVWWIRSRRTSGDRLSTEDVRIWRRTLVLRVAAVSFSALYLLMSRFALYAMPLLLLWTLYELRLARRRETVASHAPMMIKPVVAVALCLAIALPGVIRQATTYLERTSAGPDQARLREWQALSAAIPAGARVAADWRATGILALFAPQGRYLNVLDPVFMATPHPRAHRALRRVLAGQEPDVPTVVQRELASDYLLVRTVGADESLVARLTNDPRVTLAYRGSYLLARVDGSSSMFVAQGWRGVQGTRGPESPAQLPESRGSAYVSGEAFRYEGPCLTAETAVARAPDRRRTLELAPRGQTTVWIDGELAAAIAPGVDAVLGRGLMLQLPPAGEATTSVVTVQTCEPRAGEVPGFYLAAG